MLTVTSVRFEEIESKKRLKAVASIVIDQSLIISKIKLLQNERRMFIEFPSSTKDNAHPDIIPLSATVRNYIETEIISAYHKTIQEVNA